MARFARPCVSSQRAACRRSWLNTPRQAPRSVTARVTGMSHSTSPARGSAGASRCSTTRPQASAYEASGVTSQPRQRCRELSQASSSTAPKPGQRASKWICPPAMGRAASGAASLRRSKHCSKCSGTAMPRQSGVSPLTSASSKSADDGADGRRAATMASEGVNAVMPVAFHQGSGRWLSGPAAGITRPGTRYPKLFAPPAYRARSGHHPRAA